MNRKTSIIITTALVIGLGVIFAGDSKSEDSANTAITGTVQNSEIKDGIQYITVRAKGGYLPRVSTAKAGIPTKLIVKTENTYDCSASLIVRSLGFQKILSRTGEEVIDIGTPRAGESLRGICSMGMYNFLINFS